MCVRLFTAVNTRWVMKYVGSVSKPEPVEKRWVVNTEQLTVYVFCPWQIFLQQ